MASEEEFESKRMVLTSHALNHFFCPLGFSLSFCVLHSCGGFFPQLLVYTWNIARGQNLNKHWLWEGVSLQLYCTIQCLAPKNTLPWFFLSVRGNRPHKRVSGALCPMPFRVFCTFFKEKMYIMSRTSLFPPLNIWNGVERAPDGTRFQWRSVAFCPNGSLFWRWPQSKKCDRLQLKEA